MEGARDSASSEQTSLDAMLQEMEVSADADFPSLVTTCAADDIVLGGEVEVRDAVEAKITTCAADDIVLGGEVEVRDAVEAKITSAADGRQRQDPRPLEAAGVEPAAIALNYLQGVAQEICSGLDGAIGLEIEVARRLSTSTGSGSPVELRVEDGQRNVPVLAENEGTGRVSSNIAYRGKGVRGERGRKRGRYIPPVTVWRECLDSQDLLQEYARNVAREEKEKGEQGKEEGSGDIPDEVAREEEDMVTGRKENRDESEREEVRMETENDDQGGKPQESRSTGDSGDCGEEEGEPDHLEMFLPSHTPLYRQASLSSRAGAGDAVSNVRDLEVAEEFLEQENELLQNSRWVPFSVELARPQADLLEVRSSVRPTGEAKPDRPSDSHRGTVMAREHTRAGSSEKRSSIHPLAESGVNDPGPQQHSASEKAKRVGESSAAVQPRRSPVPQLREPTTDRIAVSNDKRSDVVRPTKNKSPPTTRSRSAAIVKPSVVATVDRSGDKLPGMVVSDAARDEEDTQSDSSFFFHDSEMEQEGGACERVITLHSPSGTCSSEYESAMEVHVEGGEEGSSRHEQEVQTPEPVVKSTKCVQSGREASLLRQLLRKEEAVPSMGGAPTGRGGSEVNHNLPVEPPQTTLLVEVLSDKAPSQHNLTSEIRAVGSQGEGRGRDKGKRPQECAVLIKKLLIGKVRMWRKEEGVEFSAGKVSGVPFRGSNMTSAFEDSVNRLVPLFSRHSKPSEHKNLPAPGKRDNWDAFHSQVANLLLFLCTAESRTARENVGLRGEEVAGDSVGSRGEEVAGDSVGLRGEEVAGDNVGSRGEEVAGDSVGSREEEVAGDSVGSREEEVAGDNAEVRGEEVGAELRAKPPVVGSRGPSLRLCRDKHLPGDMTGNATISTPPHSQLPFQPRTSTQTAMEQVYIMCLH